jgi:predicted metal-binding protein
MFITKVNKEVIMSSKKKIAIFICDRYSSCAGGKCFKALQNREGAFQIYEGKEVEVVGYTSCGGCPGGNIEYAPQEMIKNGAEIIHLATGLVVGYPPCPRINYFKEFIENTYNTKVVIGTHPIPEKYFKKHNALKTWDTPEKRKQIELILNEKELRKNYN